MQNEVFRLGEVPRRFSLRARYVFPIVAPPIAGGVITVEEDTIVDVRASRDGRPVRDLGNVAILPGLINAHTHLEFSSLQRPLGAPGTSIPDWISQVIAWRRERDADPAEAPLSCQRAIRQGITESCRAGVIAIGEIATARWNSAVIEDESVELLVFLELLGLDPKRVQPLFQTAEDHLAQASGAPRRWRAALSPHAPYTVHPDLLARIVRLSRQAAVPIAMHLAESREEVELLDAGTGPLVERLSHLDAWYPNVIPRGTRPADYLRLLAGSHRALIIHGNYLQQEDFQVLSNNRGRLTVVYCPRTHRYFAHQAYPLAQLLAHGIPVALGTDSRATNPDLHIMEEIRAASRLHASVAPAAVLEMGTINAARALGLGRRLGTLEAGKRAALTIVPLPDHGDSDPAELVLASAQPARRFTPGDAG